MRDVIVSSTAEPYAQDIAIGKHCIRADEPTDQGGGDAGPGPHELLLGALGACTSMTIKGYAARKGWVVRRVAVRLTGASVDGTYVINRHLTIEGDLEGDQRERLVEIAKKCPVHRTLTSEVVIHTTEGSA
ncbi:MAG: OsmC family protein [Acidobacteriota bacterium]|nr:OsmC family protein [Acidobacteriota bacterium]